MKTANNAWLMILVFGMALALPACGDDDEGDSSTDGDNTETWDGVCTDETDGFEKCESNRIQWCHVLEGMDPHFHEGLNCEALGLTCREHASDDGDTDHPHFAAYCVDESLTCSEGEFACVDNAAQNCLDGVMAIEPCGTGHCHEEDDEAHCEDADDEECDGHGHLHDDECHCDEGYSQDPDDPTSCVTDLTFPELACLTFQNGKDAIAEDHQLTATNTKPGPHAHLDEVMQVSLAANATNYAHFPIMETGEYVLFLDTLGVVAKLYDKDGAELPFTNPGPNGMCETDLVDHFHISATYTGDGTDPVPAIVEFETTQDVDLKFLVMFHEEEEDHDHK